MRFSVAQIVRALMLLVTAHSTVTSVSAVFAQEEQTSAFFEDHVEPILRKRCYHCHSHASGTMKGQLALDWKSGWEKGGDSGPAIVPGHPDESLLISAVRREGFAMPPDETLSAEEIEVLVKWVEQGASDPRVLEPESTQPDSDWWSLRPLVRPAVPATASHPVDAFIDRRLSEATLQRSPVADRRALIRRLYFDVHGLMPTMHEVEAFVNDSDPLAYEKLVDTLLASPRYGERWARYWLDVIHFADSHGCEHDVYRPHAWRYRDYVIDAFNQDTPWQNFIRQQLAADALYPEQPNLIAALGFIGAGPFDQSTAGTAPVTFDYLDRDEIVTQTMAAFVSTTANCARCHAHKFDPITQEDYYALQAVFAGIGRGDREFDVDPKVHRQRRHWQQVLAATATGDASILLTEDNRDVIATWEQAQSTAPVVWSDLSIDVFLSSGGAELERLADGSIRAGGTRPDIDTYSLSSTPAPVKMTAIRLDVLSDETLPMQGPGRQDNGNLHLNEVEVQLFTPGTSKPQRLEIVGATADFNQAGWTISHAIDGDAKTAWGIYPEVAKSHHAVFEFKQPVDIQQGSKLVVMLKQLHGAGHLIGRCKLAVTDVPSARAGVLPDDVKAALNVSIEDRNDGHEMAIARYVLAMHASAELAKLPARALVYAASPNLQRGGNTGAPVPIKDVHVLARGDIEQPGEIALPGALSGVTTLPARFELDLTNESARRVALADWIASRDNPLTWRSIANRVWLFHFGEGICDTPSDFGRMGGEPSHPELLDWLACELRDGNGIDPESIGSLKHLHRVILTSETYKQVSASREDAAAMDGDNRLLWRFNRRRLDAEVFYDSILQVAGRLNLEMGGPAIQLFTQTPGPQTTPMLHYDEFDWSSPQAERRAIYRAVWRGMNDPLFEALDFPDLGLLAPKRGFSVSALQSLAVWNHPFVLHHCEVTANHIAMSTSKLDEQIREAFRRILLREPSDAELAKFVGYRSDYGLEATIRVLLNSNEFLFVE